jgi:hypothetical protein
MWHGAPISYRLLDFIPYPPETQLGELMKLNRMERGTIWLPSASSDRKSFMNVSFVILIKA